MQIQDKNAQSFIEEFNQLQNAVFDISTNHGFVEDNIPEKIALMHSELSEALEAYRHDNPPSDHISKFSGIEEEFADVIIRIMVNAQAHGFRVAEAIIAKSNFNDLRPFRHGGKKI